MDSIKQAIDYANREEHDGQDYLLQILTIQGENIDVFVYADNSPQGYLLRERIQNGAVGGEIFINPNQIISVKVLW